MTNSQNNKNKTTTTIAIKLTTKDRILSHGAMGNDYDEVINRALDLMDKEAGKHK